MQRRYARVALVVALAAALAGIATPAGARPHPPVPDKPEWGRRVLPLVRFVERDRWLKFDHSIEVELLSKRAFDDRVQLEFEFGGGEVGDTLRRLSALGLVGTEVRAKEVIEAGLLYGYFDPYF